MGLRSLANYFFISIFVLSLQTKANRLADAILQARETGRFDGVKPLLDKDRSIIETLFFSAQNDYADVLRFLFDYRPESNKFLRSINNEGRTPPHLASEQGHVHTVAFFIENRETLGLSRKELKIAQKQVLMKEGMRTYYLMRKKLGMGAFATVWKGFSWPDKRVLAVKTIDLSRVSQRLLNEVLPREIELSLALKHPNLLNFEASSKDDNHLYLYMEYCGGGSLHDRIKNEKPIDEPVLRGLIQQLVRGLIYLHEQQIAHRDLKPQNILFNEEGTLKIADFGFARFCSEGEMMETICGTPLYMAPELLKQKRYDGKADLWSLGVLMYQMATGVFPYRASSLMELLRNIQHNPLQQPRHISDNCWDLIMKLLTIKPENRIGFDELVKHPFIKEEEQAPGQVENVGGVSAEGFLSDRDDFSESFWERSEEFLSVEQMAIGDSLLALQSVIPPPKPIPLADEAQLGSQLIPISQFPKEQGDSSEVPFTEASSPQVLVYTETQKLIRRMYVLLSCTHLFVSKKDKVFFYNLLGDFVFSWKLAYKSAEKTEEENRIIEELGRIALPSIQSMTQPVLALISSDGLMSTLDAAFKVFVKKAAAEEIVESHGEAISLYRMGDILLERMLEMADERSRAVLLRSKKGLNIRIMTCERRQARGRPEGAPG